MKKYDEVFNLRIDKETREVLKRESADAKIGESEYIRRLIISRNISNDALLDIRKCIVEINRIGNNINQIARMMNLYHFSGDEVEEIRKHQMEVKKMVDKIRENLYGNH